MLIFRQSVCDQKRRLALLILKGDATAMRLPII